MPQQPVVDDTFMEAFKGIFCRVIITADDKETLCKAVRDSTATPSVVIGRTEGGLEKISQPKRNS
jgi:formylmethanofuran--tetrahydromethanopterin N-formyltransferase